MAEFTPAEDTVFQQALVKHERQDYIDTFKVASWLVIVLMPAGAFLDYCVYPQHLGFFFGLRLASSALAFGQWLLLRRAVTQKFYRLMGPPIALGPAVFICLMIYATDGPKSSYYVGLNLIPLAIGVVVHWTTWESVLAFATMMGMYLLVCFAFVLHHPHAALDKTFVSQLIFMGQTGVIMVVGNHYFNLLRRREFKLRYQLNRQFKELQEAEVQLVQSEKLASLGRMSAGLIHEINNPLNYAKTGLYTIKKKGKLLPAESQADFTEIVTDVEDGLNRVVAIVSDLRSFSHHDDSQTEDVDVADMMATALRFVSHEWAGEIQLEQNFAPGLTIAANKNKLIQVCTNLLENSLDALKSKKFPADQTPRISLSSRLENGFIKLVFRDNGPGIPASVRDKIFDPFFTTKDVGDGMGLGLSICRTIVQQCNGEIRLESEPDVFTEFTLEFRSKA